MSALTTVVAAFVLAVLVATLMWGGPGIVLVLPLALVALGVAFAMDVNKRRRSAASLHDHREQARTQKVDFTERDEQTLVSK